ncbi:MAG: hypothetical protein GY847_13280, partial [Proteobacteria bacterium]|nr:hypothetical protein [Pseudomonadota bacterium]MCP4601468.1 hypothetical protein [Pseudomonadota bacterium]
MARLPRWQREGAVFSETRRTIDRQFLLKPCPETRNIIGACLGRALAKNKVKLYWFEPNVNHPHDGLGPVDGEPTEISAFYKHFYS